LLITHPHLIPSVFVTLRLLTTVIHLFLFLSVAHSQATWIMGAALFSGYVVVAVGFWVHIDEPLENTR
jgi:hypothetical protein